MKAIDILIGIDRLQHTIGIDLLGQRQLYQNAIHQGIGIQTCY